MAFATSAPTPEHRPRSSRHPRKWGNLASRFRVSSPSVKGTSICPLSEILGWSNCSMVASKFCRHSLLSWKRYSAASPWSHNGSREPRQYLWRSYSGHHMYALKQLLCPAMASNRRRNRLQVTDTLNLGVFILSPPSAPISGICLCSFCLVLMRH